MMYNYYCFETDSAWDICAVRGFLEKCGLHSADGYSYDNKDPFISISLLYLTGGSGWNSEHDRHERLCSYIPIVTSDISDNEPTVWNVLQGLEALLGTAVREDW